MTPADKKPEDLHGEISELKNALKDAGIDIDAIRRQKAEQEEQKRRREERFARVDADHAAREEADRAEALKFWQEGVFVVDLNGKRLRAPKDLTIRCPHCRKELLAVNGWWLDLLGAYRMCAGGRQFRLAGLPSIGPPWSAVPAIEDSFTCPCGEQIHVRMQMLLPTK